MCTFLFANETQSTGITVAQKRFRGDTQIRSDEDVSLVLSAYQGLAAEA